MNTEPNPEDNPFFVTMVASQLLGRSCDRWELAVDEARRKLRSARYRIADQKEEERFEQELAEEPMPENKFIDWMVGDLVSRNRYARRKEFFYRMWPKFREANPRVPALADPLMRTNALWMCIADFRRFCEKYRTEARRTNAKKPRKKRKDKISAAFEKNCLRSTTPYREAKKPPKTLAR
jgi:hypothetical protein